MTRHHPRQPFAALALVLALGLAGCADMQLPGGAGSAKSDTQEPSASAPPEDSTISFQTPAVKAYRKVGANAIYKKYPQRIYPGKIPPLVYAVVVVETHVNADGSVKKVTFSRTPSHAPEVPPMIAQLVMDASPLPAPPGNVGAHTYIDTWLWDRSGRFQLDTLTKGQRSR